MKAALKTAEGRFEVTEVERPTLAGRDWVIARVRVAGICGTDLRHWQKPDPHLQCTIMGHELAGEVVEVGEDVDSVAVGDRVVIETVLGDDECDWCRIQRYNLCPHLYEVRTKNVSRAYAEYVTGPAKKFRKLPDHVSFEEAALLDTFSVSLHGLNLGNVKLGDTVAIIGAGPIGLAMVQLAKTSGARVICTDVIASSLECARNYGAELVIDTSGDEDAAERVRAFTDGRGADIVFECAGGTSMPKTLPQAVELTRIGGKVVIVGGFDAGNTAIEMDWQRLQTAEIQLIPSASFSFRDIYPEMRLCLDMLAAGTIDAKGLISRSFPLDRINEAFEYADDKDNTGAIFVAIEI